MIYFDNAATSFPKPRAVYSEVVKCITCYCGNAGHGSHALALKAAQKVYECRERLSDFFSLNDPARVFFTVNTTQALNTVIKGILRKGDHVLISDIEHNAVYRPIFRLAADGRISYDIYPSMLCDERRSPTRICAGIARLMRPNTRLVICTLASNLCSAVMPIAEIGDFCHRHGVLFAVDGAQGAGHIPIDMSTSEVDAVCIPSHKGLYGIQGAGAVLLGENIVLDTLIEGGNGVNSLEGEMPLLSPERYEAGTLPTPAIVGLSEGIKWISERGVEAVAEHERVLFKRAREALCNMAGVTVYADEYVGSVLMLSVEGMSSESVTRRLDASGICVRGGFHCCPLGHKTLKTPDDGAVRVSFGAMNTEREVDFFIDTMRKIKFV